MSDLKKDYGMLLNQNIKLHRKYFEEMTKLIGINCQYRAPIPGKQFDAHGDLDANYLPPITVGCILSDHPDQKTLKKMGWVAELGESSLLLHVPYDLPGLQYGALFTLPSGLDKAEGRIFRVISMQNIMVYPASITCEISPEYEDNDEQSTIHDFTQTTYTVLADNEEDD